MKSTIASLAVGLALLVPATALAGPAVDRPASDQQATTPSRVTDLRAPDQQSPAGAPAVDLRAPDQQAPGQPTTSQPPAAPVATSQPSSGDDTPVALWILAAIGAVGIAGALGYGVARVARRTSHTRVHAA